LTLLFCFHPFLLCVKHAYHAAHPRVSCDARALVTMHARNTSRVLRGSVPCTRTFPLPRTSHLPITTKKLSTLPIITKKSSTSLHTFPPSTYLYCSFSSPFSPFLPQLPSPYAQNRCWYSKSRDKAEKVATVFPSGLADIYNRSFITNTTNTTHQHHQHHTPTPPTPHTNTTLHHPRYTTPTTLLPSKHHPPIPLSSFPSGTVQINPPSQYVIY
jgi:hypothetical protein